MKKIITILFFLFVTINTYSQTSKTIKVDTTQMCIPYDVAQKMLLDLNDYDRLKELSVLDKKEIYQLNNKILFLEKTNQTWQEKDSLSSVIIKETEQKVEIYKEENQNLSKENKRLKTKNTLFNIISGAIIAPLTYMIIFK
jgi:hypothetical protein